jgi:hypothetical protein
MHINWEFHHSAVAEQTGQSNSYFGYYKSHLLTYRDNDDTYEAILPFPNRSINNMTRRCNSALFSYGSINNVDIVIEKGALLQPNVYVWGEYDSHLSSICYFKWNTQTVKLYPSSTRTHITTINKSLERSRRSISVNRLYHDYCTLWAIRENGNEGVYPFVTLMANEAKRRQYVSLMTRLHGTDKIYNRQAYTDYDVTATPLEDTKGMFIAVDPFFAHANPAIVPYLQNNTPFEVRLVSVYYQMPQAKGKIQARFHADQFKSAEEMADYEELCIIQAIRRTAKNLYSRKEPDEFLQQFDERVLTLSTVVNGVVTGISDQILSTNTYTTMPNSTAITINMPLTNSVFDVPLNNDGSI